MIPFSPQPNVNGVIKDEDTTLYTSVNTTEVRSIIITNKNVLDIQFNLYIRHSNINTSLIPEGQFILKSKHTFIWDTLITLGNRDSIIAKAAITDELTYSLSSIIS